MIAQDRERQVAIAYDRFLNGESEPEEIAGNWCGFVTSKMYQTVPPVTPMPNREAAINKLWHDKFESNNIIDLEAYNSGLVDMYDYLTDKKLQP
jgi:hypothetical protein